MNRQLQFLQSQSVMSITAIPPLSIDSSSISWRISLFFLVCFLRSRFLSNRLRRCISYGICLSHPILSFPHFSSHLLILRLPRSLDFLESTGFLQLPFFDEVAKLLL